MVLAENSVLLRVAPLERVLESCNLDQDVGITYSFQALFVLSLYSVKSLAFSLNGGAHSQM